MRARATPALLFFFVAPYIAGQAAAQACLHEELQLLPDDPAQGAQFGRAVGVSGTTAVVGSCCVAYLYDTTSGQRVATLLPVGAPVVGQGFGQAVAISGSTVVVGALAEDVSGSNSGTAFVFDAGSAQQTFQLTPADGAAGDEFGSSVAVDGTTAVVGAWRDGDNGANSGSAYVFDTATGQELFKLVPSDGTPFKYFGAAVDVCGTTAIVSAYLDRSAYLFDTTTGQEIRKLVPSPVGNLFIGVGIDGGIAAVGETLFDATTGAQLLQLVPDTPTSSFGTWVDVSGTTVLVSALGEASGAGRAYLFDATTGQQRAKLFLSAPAYYGELGAAVSIDGPVAVVGAPKAWISDPASGAAYVFDADAGPAEVYCTPKPNSAGCPAGIAGSGTPSASSPDPFDVTAAGVINLKNGLLFYGTSGPAALPFFGGTLCVTPPLRRTAVQSSGGSAPPAVDCTGTFTFDFNATIQSGTDPGLLPGLAAHAQYWWRDPGHPDGTGVGLTDAVAFVICP